MAKTRWGPGTVTITPAGGTALSFEAEVKSGGILHAYEDVGEAVTYLDGTNVPSGKQRGDQLTFEIDFDLSAAGVYAALEANDLRTATFDYTPNTADGASWTGTVVLTLPDQVAADEYGAILSGTVTWDLVGPATFTAAA